MKKYRSILMLIAVTMLFAGCGKKTVAATDEDTETVFAVDTVKAIKGEINDYIKLSGDVKAQREVKVYPDQQGKIAVVNVKLGAMVQKGQILIEIDPSKPGMIYSNSPVRAPVDGTITSLPYKIGETVNVQTPVTSIGQLDQIEIDTSVSEKYISKMKTGLGALFTVDAYPDVTFKGVVTEVSPVVDPLSRMLAAKITVQDPNQRLLKPGMFADIKIITEKKENTVKIPSECLSQRYGETFVFVIKELPTEITNIVLENKIINQTKPETGDNKKLLSPLFSANTAKEETNKKTALSEDDMKLINRYFPKSLPVTLRVETFEYSLLKSLKDPKDIEALKSLYTLNKEKEVYELKESQEFTDVDEHVWQILVAQKYKYVITTPKEIKLSHAEIEQMRTILINANNIDASTMFVEKRVIQPGIEIDNKTEVNAGLRENEEIVFYGQSLLENNSQVRIMRSLSILGAKDIIK